MHTVRRRVSHLGTLVLALGCAAATAGTGRPAANLPPGDRLLPVVVRGHAGHDAAAVAAVRRAGGEVSHELPVIHGAAARVPASKLPGLRAAPGVAAVTPDGTVRLLSSGSGSATDTTTLAAITEIVKAQDSWGSGYSGKGIDVALVDSGVAPVPGLTSGNVVNGPDLSFESQRPELAHLDTYGHGTHMAGIIAGREVPFANPKYYSGSSGFYGVAPDVRLVSVKVASADGATDVSQVIAAINWVTEHGRRNGLNVRVLNLSFGTDATQDPAVDPLVHAAEAAWRAGIVVVVAGGNAGHETASLANPAHSPNLLAVGAADPRGTIDVADDTAPAFTSRGSDKRFVDVVAPGVSVQSLRVPGSYIDAQHPGAVAGTRFFRGSGTSQAAAVVSGVAALVLQRYPDLTPDQVKSLLMQTAQATLADKRLRGSGVVDAKRAQSKSAPKLTERTAPWGTGQGSLEAARGSFHVSDGTATLSGELDIFGKAWDPVTWTARVAAGTSWNGGDWNGSTWTGSSWTGSSWTGSSWTGSTWSGSTWTGSTWSGSSWTGSSWTGSTWTGDGWSGSTWSNSTWASYGWNGSAWAGATWQ